MSKLTVRKIISGGQTGADRAALDFAITHGIPHGGWCPKGRRAEDGPIDKKYLLDETGTAEYLERTERNVLDSDGTVLFSIAPTLSGGSKSTVEFALTHSKPLLHFCRATAPDSPELELLKFIGSHRIQILNVAGPRASEEPEIGSFVTQVLERAWLAAP